MRLPGLFSAGPSEHPRGEALFDGNRALDAILSPSQGKPAMSVLIKLRMEDPKANLQQVLALPGIAGLDVDREYGLICINPRDNLYVVRVTQVEDIDRRMKLSPEILGVYGDVRISPF